MHIDFIKAGKHTQKLLIFAFPSSNFTKTPPIANKIIYLQKNINI